MTYSDRIAELALGPDPRHIEAYMRLFSPTLDGLTLGEFEALAKKAAVHVVVEGSEAAERLAQTFGLTRG